MINRNTLVVFDFETGGLDVETLEPLQIAAVALDPRTLEVKDEFPQTLMRPLDFQNLNPVALQVNGITREELATAPEQKLVWARFAQWVKSHNVKGGFNSAPIPCGKNVRHFDIPIAERLCRTYSFTSKSGRPNLFHPRTVIELEEILFWWFEDSDELENLKMDTLRPYFGFSKDGAHSAMVDVRQTAELIVRLLKLHRTLKSRRRPDGDQMIRFEGSCSQAACGGA